MFGIKSMSPINKRGLYVVFAVVLLVTNYQAQSKDRIVPVNNQTVKPASKIKFSSVYTKLNFKSCKPISKPESEEDEIPLICKGYKNYKIFVSEHGVMPPIYIGREISTNMEAWDASTLPWFIPDQTTGGTQIIEWRLADGEPFACIVRTRFNKQIINPDEKGEANELVVKNLKGFAPISVSIDTQKNKRANQEARRAADKGYRKL